MEPALNPPDVYARDPVEDARDQITETRLRNWWSALTDAMNGDLRSFTRDELLAANDALGYPLWRFYKDGDAEALKDAMDEIAIEHILRTEYGPEME